MPGSRPAAPPPPRSARAAARLRSPGAARERAELVGVAPELARGASALLAGKIAVDIEHHRHVLLARGLDRRRVGRVAAAIEVRHELGQTLPRFFRAQAGEQLCLQALVVAVAEFVQERRPLGILLYPLNLRSRQPPHPVLQSLDVALGTAPAALALAATQVLPREAAVVFRQPPPPGAGCAPRPPARGRRRFFRFLP